jgi:hypothetical protein
MQCLHLLYGLLGICDISSFVLSPLKSLPQALMLLENPENPIYDDAFVAFYDVFVIKNSVKCYYCIHTLLC